MPESFEQQPREGAKAFAAFSVYLSLGPERSLAAVGRKLGKSVRLHPARPVKAPGPALHQPHTLAQLLPHRRQRPFRA